MVVAEQSPPLLLRIPQAAGTMGIGVSTLYRLIREGAIPVVRPTAYSARIARSDIDRWIEERRERRERREAA